MRSRGVKSCATPGKPSSHREGTSSVISLNEEFLKPRTENLAASLLREALLGAN